MDYTYDPDHPIQLSKKQIDTITPAHVNTLLKAAAQLGADMQLERVCEWMSDHFFSTLAINALKTAMRPPTLSKREQALKLLDVSSKYEQATLGIELTSAQIALIREALMEGQGDG